MGCSSACRRPDVDLLALGGSGSAILIGVVGLGLVWFQWYKSDTVAMKAMGAREVSPEQAPELHGMIDRLCALADMPKPRVGIADTDLPNAFATGRSPQRSVVVVTTGILKRLDAEELEGVLAHELSHVAHRDVLVMTVASSAGIIAGMLTRGAQYGAIFGGGRRDNNNSGLPVWLVVLVVSLVTYAVSFLLLKLLSRYRELSADRAGAYLTMKPEALASALQKITGEINTIPDRDLRASQPMNAFFIAPAVSGVSLRTLTSTHPTLEQRLEQLAKIRAELEPHRLMGFWDVIAGRSRPKAAQAGLAVPGPERGDHAARRARAAADRRRVGLLPRRRGPGVPAGAGRGRRAAQRRPGRARRRGDPGRVRLHLAGRPRRPRRPGRRCAPTCTRSTPRWRTRASAPGCSARWSPSRAPTGAGSGWSTSTSGARSTRSRPSRAQQQRDNLLEIQLRDTLDRRAPDGAGPRPLAGRLGAPGL